MSIPSLQRLGLVDTRDAKMDWDMVSATNDSHIVLHASSQAFLVSLSTQCLKFIDLHMGAYMTSWSTMDIHSH